MREKELRLALVCYGGISLAVYMHGITKEIWHLARASRAFHAGEAPASKIEGVYHRLLELARDTGETHLRVLVDILAGASAGGINAIFLADAISSGRSLDPLTDLWLEVADVDRLIDPGVSGISRFAKGAAVPFAWALSSRSGTVEETVEPEHRAEVRAKLANFVRARWFAPPFGGPSFTRLLLDAVEAMKAGSDGASLLPEHQPLDLFVTVTDFHGHPERLRLNSPPEVTEREHRLTLAFRDPGGPARRLADAAELVYAARGTASFPGAFPPFRVQELDEVLKERDRAWPGREAFLARSLPRHAARGEAEEAVLIDGSVLANAPFGPALAALQNRPARREVDRRFVYIDPKPGRRSIRLTSGAASEPPGFFATIFGALSDIPREQPIRDNLESIERRSSRIRRLRRIVESMRPEVEAAIERAAGSTFFLLRPTPKRLAAWRGRTNEVAAREAGYAYAAYGQLKIATIAEDIAAALHRLSGGGDGMRKARIRQAIWSAIRGAGLNAPDAVTAKGARPDVILFLRKFDVGFRSRRLRFVARMLTAPDSAFEAPRAELDAVRRVLYDMIGRYGAAAERATDDPNETAALAASEEAPIDAIEALGARMALQLLDDETDSRLAEALSALPKGDRRQLILAYLGYPFYDIATLPLLQGEGLDEFDPVKVDRISPEDCDAIRPGGAEATLKGIQFNSFGAFFSRAYRENDYLWGRLHGAERMIDITLSSLPEGNRPGEALVAALKRDAFRAILAEEKPRLSCLDALFAEMEREIG
jgi:patatin-related protein